MIHNIPLDFTDTDKITNEYIKINTDSSFIEIRTCLNCVKNGFNIKILDSELLNEIDEKMDSMIKNNLPFINNKRQKLQYQLKCASMFRRIITTLTGFSFKSNYFNKGNNIVAFKHWKIYDNDKYVKLMVDNCIDFMKSVNLSMRTMKDTVNKMIKYIPHLAEKVYNRTITRNDLLKIIQDIEDSSKVDRITKVKDMKTSDISDSARNLCMSLNIFIKSGAVDFHPIRYNEIKIKEKNLIIQDKDYFTDEELEKIASSYKDDRERLIFTIFLSTGMRVGGMMNIKVKYVFDEKLNVLSSGQTLEEKGHKIRKFSMFPAMKQALEIYRDGIYGSVLKSPEHYIFTQYNKKTKNYLVPSLKKCAVGSIQHVIHSVCERVGINGCHVHPHALRKTVVVKLMSEGNTIESVSKFIGHASSDITAKHYWTPTQNDLIKTMNLSWLVGTNIVNEDGRTSFETSSANTDQMKQIASLIVEGVKAKKRLEHAISTMNKEQINTMEKLWTTETEEEVANLSRIEISRVVNVVKTLTEYSTTLTNKTNDVDIDVSDNDVLDNETN